MTLTRGERARLETLTSKGKHSAQQVLNALVLVGCDGGGFQKQRSKNEELSYVLNLGMREIDRVKERFVMEGLEAALSGRNHNRVYRKKANCEF